MGGRERERAGKCVCERQYGSGRNEYDVGIVSASDIVGVMRSAIAAPLSYAYVTSRSERVCAVG